MKDELETSITRGSAKLGEMGRIDDMLSKKPLDTLLEKYGKKAHYQIRSLIDENRHIALDLPERAIPMEKAVGRMLKTVEPDPKLQKQLFDAWDAEEWKTSIEPLAQQTIGALRGENVGRITQEAADLRKNKSLMQMLTDYIKYGG